MSQQSSMDNMEAHRHTYAGFVRAATVLVIASCFLLVALCSFAFGSILPILVGFGGLLAGAITLLVDIRSGGKFMLSIGLLVVYGLFVAVSVT